MCGIFGSNDLTEFKQLYRDNLTRGSKAVSFIEFERNFGRTTEHIFKMPIDIDAVLFQKPDPGDNFYYLGHTQAPTTCEREPARSNMHPFRSRYLLVAHNGVISNYSELVKTYNARELLKSSVDSEIIPKLIGLEFSDYDTHIGILKTLELLEGTVGIWCLDEKSKKVYIARNGSTLYFNDTSFSSVKTASFNELPNGCAYDIFNNILLKTVIKSSYFIDE